MNTDELIRWHRSEASALRHAAAAGTARTTPEPTLSGLLGRAKLHDYFAELVTHLAARSHRPTGSDDSRGGWISVEERLPELKQRVIFWIPQGICFGFRCGDNEWADESFTDRDGLPHSWFGVEFWQPLPEPPASRSEG